jgi:hypothetical protein
MKLPDQRHIIPPDIFIGGNKRHFFGKGCCDKQAVKGITVSQSASGLRWSLPSANSTNLLAGKGSEMSSLNGEYGNFVGLGQSHKPPYTDLEIQLPQAGFNRQFPGGDHAHIDGIGIIPYDTPDSIGQFIIAVEKPNSGMSVQQVASHLHIVLKVVKGRVKVVRHPELSLGAAKHPFFQLGLHCRLGRKGKDNRPRRNLAGNFNCQPVAGGYVYSLLYGHSISIVKNRAGSKRNPRGKQIRE